MPDALSSPLDLHSRLIEIAQKAVRQIQEHPRPADAVLPPDLPTSGAPDPPYSR